MEAFFFFLFHSFIGCSSSEIQYKFIIQKKKKKKKKRKKQKPKRGRCNGTNVPCKAPPAKVNTAISRKVVRKSARDNPKRYCGWFRVHCFSEKFQRMAREAMNVCLRVLKESNKSRFDSYSARKSALIISHITFRDCRVHSFSDNLSRNSCIQRRRLFPYWKFGLNVLFWEITNRIIK